MRLELFAGLVILSCSGSLLADGVAYRLPPDGTWVKYRITPGEEFTLKDFRTDARRQKVLTEVKMPNAPPNYEDLFLVRSVGRVVVDGRPHRWLELVNEPAEEGKERPTRRVIVLKLLIPEQTFCAGTDPFAHVKKMYLSDRRSDGQLFVNEVKDADGRKYQLERFQALFPVPAKDAKRKDGVERRTAAGTFRGYELDFDYGFDGKLYGGKKGRNMFKGHYKVLVSEAAPFGIAEIVNVTSEGLEDLGNGTGHVSQGKGGRMEPIEVGAGAKSGLPDLK